VKAERRGPAAMIDLAAQAQKLIATLVSRPWGQISPSVYETGRLVVLAPWLTEHRGRVEYLLRMQRPDGGWGGPAGYALVPTLSATDALLAILRGVVGGYADGYVDRVQRTRLSDAIDQGLRKLFGLLRDLDDGAAIPDTPAADLIAAALVESVNLHLNGLRDSPSADLGQSAGVARLRLPAGLTGTRLTRVKAALGAGFSPPEKLFHALEVLTADAPNVRVGPTPSGVVGASPAATAAWLGQQGLCDPADPARRFLETVAKRVGGPVPCGIPVTVFERAWVIASLGRAGIAVSVPSELTASLETALNPRGTAAGDGLPADADTTSVALYALGLLGLPFRPHSLQTFWAETHFSTWLGEDGFSVSVNAHALEAFGQYVATYPTAAPRYANILARLSELLRDHQRTDGSWADRWHASRYYATACCVLALDRFGGAAAEMAIRRAMRWTIATQRADGSWGLWEGTAEETAYALQILLSAHAIRTAVPGEAERARQAAAQGRAYLLQSFGDWAGPPLWHDKDLYQPFAIVQAAILAALHLAELQLAHLDG
jgi:halimadienyl-diphosphate synthase